MNTKFYRKKPVVIQALKWDGENQTEIMNFCKSCYFTSHGKVKDLFIETLEGDMQASIGDYIIRGVKGEFYACKPDVFELTYETVV
jgi:hypothetical protein